MYWGPEPWAVGRMEGADKSTEPWRYPPSVNQSYLIFLSKFWLGAPATKRCLGASQFHLMCLSVVCLIDMRDI